MSTKNFAHENFNWWYKFYKSNVEISNSVILNSKCEDAINIIKSNFKFINSQIINSLSDGLNSDFSNGYIKILLKILEVTQ